MTWWQYLLLAVFGLSLLIFLSCVFYKQFFKRFWDILLSGLGIIILSPIFVVLCILGLIFMKGNPFFVQERPGKKDKNGQEKIFKLLKFRTMSNQKDDFGNYLPDASRLNNYGRFLRSTSLDELPQLLNIFVGDMSIVGPRPLLMSYLERYNENQRHRHDVRPGLTGFAQSHGRNSLSWEEKFAIDVWYTKNISFFGDLKIIMETILAVFKREGINSSSSATVEEFMGNNK